MREMKYSRQKAEGLAKKDWDELPNDVKNAMMG
jgi:hypothetical protein